MSRTLLHNTKKNNCYEMKVNMKYISLFIKYSNYKALVVLTITNIFLTVLNLLYTFITGQYIDLLTTSNKN